MPFTEYLPRARCCLNTHNAPVREGLLFSPTLQLGRLRFREVKCLAFEHKCKWPGWALNALSVTSVCLLCAHWPILLGSALFSEPPLLSCYDGV